MNEEIKEKEWCCWTLSESEIEHVAEDIFETGYSKGLITDEEMNIIVQYFKDAINMAFENWEDVLKTIVYDCTKGKDIRMISILKSELNNIKR